MRSTAFALLGLTAAAGLALVAIFAQPGFPLLEPVPLPNQPPARQGVARALALPVGHRRTPLAPAASGQSTVPRPSAGGSGGGARTGGGLEAGAVAPEGTSAVQAPVAEPPDGSGGGGHGGRGGAAAPAPTATPQPASTTGSTPVSTPEPVEQAPEATSSAGPKVAERPGSPSSAAAAEHASERGVEASSKGSGSAAPQASAPTAASSSGPGPAPEASGQGNAYAKGQTK